MHAWATIGASPFVDGHPVSTGSTEAHAETCDPISAWCSIAAPQLEHEASEHEAELSHSLPADPLATWSSVGAFGHSSAVPAYDCMDDEDMNNVSKNTDAIFDLTSHASAVVNSTNDQEIELRSRM